MKHPHVFCRLEATDKIYDARDYQIHQERQRPTLGYFELEEPVEKDSLVILELGYLGKAFRNTVLKVTSCSQVAKDTFDVVAIESIREMLDAPFIDQLMGVTLEAALKQICRRMGLTFRSQGTPPRTKPKNLVFLSTIRNALDQLWEVFELTDARWMTNLITNEFVFLPRGRFETEAFEFPMEYFKRETANGLEMEIIPMLKPYTPVIWREEERIIDIVRLDKKTGTCFIGFAEAA